MPVSNLTNGCKMATVELTGPQLVRITIALQDHIEELNEREKRDPGDWTVELELAREALRIVKEA